MSATCLAATTWLPEGLSAFFDALACDARFNTLCFLLLFAPLTIAMYWALPARRAKLAWLTVMSFVFYALWDWRFSGLIILSALLDFFVAQRIQAAATPRRKKQWLAASVVINLGLLGFFKYAVFTLANFQSLLDVLGVGLSLPAPHIVLPVGISFYTFQTISYSVDVYRGHVEPTRDFLKYLAYVSMFPQLVAGPIVRYRTLSDQLDNVPMRPSAAFLRTGITIFVIGLFKKVVIADSLSDWIDPYWDDPSSIGFWETWFFVSGFILEFYFDFSGYSEMALGLGAMLGLRFPVNFHAPHSAKNLAELWRRWHITLMSFVRDYVYIPLGGNRVSRPRRYLNLFIIFFITAIWHQASWNMVVFGAWQATCISLYLLAQTWWDSRHVLTQRFMTIIQWLMGMPAFAGINFKAAGDIGIGAANLDLTLAGTSITNMLHFYSGMFGLHGLGGFRSPAWHGLAVLALMLWTMFAKPAIDYRFQYDRRRAVAIGLVLGACIVIVATNNSPFLYYQF